MRQDPTIGGGPVGGVDLHAVKAGGDDGLGGKDKALHHVENVRVGQRPRGQRDGQPEPKQLEGERRRRHRPRVDADLREANEAKRQQYNTTSTKERNSPAHGALPAGVAELHQGEAVAAGVAGGGPRPQSGGVGGRVHGDIARALLRGKVSPPIAAHRGRSAADLHVTAVDHDVAWPHGGSRSAQPGANR